MANSMTKPLGMATGGLVPGICPDPSQANPADLAKSADSAEGAAARIKQSEADAKARRAAVRYLGTVDCKRFPEAEAALINALLADTNECVRWEAAQALGRGCCCTKKTVQALMQVVSGKAENDPPETSERVRCAAAAALERCLARCGEGLREPPRRPENPVPPERPAEAGPRPEPIPTPSPNPAGDAQGDNNSFVDQARRVLAEYRMRTQGVPRTTCTMPGNSVVSDVPQETPADEDPPQPVSPQIAPDLPEPPDPDAPFDAPTITTLPRTPADALREANRAKW
jgi:hypothetical protein